MKLQNVESYFVLVIIAIGYIASTSAAADELGKIAVSFGGFIDTYYDYDFNTPPTIDRGLTNSSVFGTQAVRTNEFNINLAYVEAKVSADRIRGRFALQTGTSVQANYAGESNALGTIKQLIPAEIIQEAYAGYKISDQLWVDAGIYLSHIGLESFISRDNWNYTRSLLADLSPYYQSGVKFSYQLSPIWFFQLHILNGWQNIYNINQSKAVGLQITYTPSPKFSFDYNNIVLNEPGSLTRFFNDFIVKYNVSDSLQFAASLDVGSQLKPGGSGTSYWYGAILVARYRVNPKLSVAARLEEYADKDQVIVQTGAPSGFVASGASLNADYELQKGLVWRNEARVYAALDSIFASSSGPQASDKFLVTSLALSF